MSLQANRMDWTGVQKGTSRDREMKTTFEKVKEREKERASERGETERIETILVRVNACVVRTC